MKRIDLNELPKFSPWPGRLLGHLPWEKKEKNRDELLREYEREKWGPLLTEMQTSKKRFSLDTVFDEYFKSTPPIVVADKGKFFVTSVKEANDLARELIYSVVAANYNGEPLLELGAGFGNIMLWLAKQKKFKSTPLFAGELSESGAEIMRKIAAEEKISIHCGHCDLESPELLSFEVPENSVIFTSYSACYLQESTEAFLRKLIALKPARVIHFEPFYEHCDASTLWGLLRKRYIEMNGYNKNLLTKVRALESEGALKVLEEKLDVFAINALLVPALLTWAPV